MHELFRQTDSELPKSARQIFEYGKNKKRYWTNELFIQLARTVAEAKHPPQDFKHATILVANFGVYAYTLTLIVFFAYIFIQDIFVYSEQC